MVVCFLLLISSLLLLLLLLWLRFGMWLFLFWNVSFRTVSSLWGECWKSKLEGRICKSCPFSIFQPQQHLPRSVVVHVVSSSSWRSIISCFFNTLGYHERREIHTVMIQSFQSSIQSVMSYTYLWTQLRNRNRNAWYTVSKICIWKGIGIIIILLLLLLLIHHTDRQHDHPATVVDYWSSHCFHLIIIPRHRTGNWNRSSCRRRWRTVLEKERRWRERKITNCW